MAKQNLILNNTVGGELSPHMYGRVDIPVYQKGLKRCENFICYPQGGASYRNGSTFVKHTHGNKTAVFIPFQFSDSQAYLLEFTDLVVTFYRNNGYVLETAVATITAATAANPGVFTTGAVHGYTVGQEIFLNGTWSGGFAGLQSRALYVNTTPTTTTFTLRDVFGNVISTAGFGTYSAGGTTQRIYKIASPFTEAQLDDIKWAQETDTMWMAHQGHEPVQLTRTADNSWAFDLTPTFGGAAPVGLNGAANERPRAVAFTSDGRLAFAGTVLSPGAFWGSKQPDQATGNPRYTNFGAPSIPLDSDGYVFQIASDNGKADVIQWISSTTKFMVLGCISSVRKAIGASESSAPTPLAVNVRPVNTFGADKAPPAPAGASFFYIERGSQRIRSIDYDFEIDNYDTEDLNLVAEHISTDMRRIVFQNASPDVLWGFRTDGRLVGLTFKSKENIAGWHRHYLGGQHIDTNGVTQLYGKVISMGIMGRSTQGEQLWVIAERRINGVTARTVEYFNDKPRFPIELDFFTNNRDSDAAKFRDANYEIQKDSIHLDCSARYDGTVAGISFTLSSAAVGTRTLTASAPVFTSAMATAGRQFWRKFDSKGNGSGRATITGFTSSTVVTVDVTTAFDSTAIAAGFGMITTAAISGLNHLEGQTVGVVTDGAVHTDEVVANGAIALDYQASKVQVGLKYTGILQTLNLDLGGQTGSAETKPRRLDHIWISLLNAIGCKVGTDIYNLQTVIFPEGLTDRGVPIYNGKLKERLEDSMVEDEKTVTLMQDQPLPCTVISLGIYGEAIDE